MVSGKSVTELTGDTKPAQAQQTSRDGFSLLRLLPGKSLASRVSNTTPRARFALFLCCLIFVTAGCRAGPREHPTATIPLPDAELPGEDFPLSPQPGAVLAVVSVAHDDVLNVRKVPGSRQHIVATLPPRSNAFTATGRSRLLPASIWYEGTTANGTLGWVESRYTAQRGMTTDITDKLINKAGATPPVSNDMQSLGLAVARSQSSDEPPSTIVMVAAPATENGEQTVIFDVVGLGDDSVSAIRLQITGTAAGNGFTLSRVQSTLMCFASRGVTRTGMCI